jgi:hypothetical protein
MTNFAQTLFSSLDFEFHSEWRQVCRLSCCLHQFCWWMGPVRVASGEVEKMSGQKTSECNLYLKVEVILKYAQRISEYQASPI